MQTINFYAIISLMPSKDMKAVQLTQSSVKKQLQNRSITFIFCTCAVTAINILLLFTALISFIMRYSIFPNGRLDTIKDGAFLFDKDIFFVDFYVFILIFTLSMLTALFCKKKASLAMSYILMLFSANLCLYTVEEFFTIKIFIFIALLTTIATTSDLIYSIPIILFSIALSIAFQFYPNLLGIVDMAPPPSIESINALVTFTLSLLLAGFISCLYKFVVDSYQECELTKRHLNLVMSQMTAINSQLQDFARTKSKEAAEEERLRITRDMHDSCGYVFVNIISLMDALASSKPMTWEKTKEAFETVHYLAKHGLQETRKTLRAIREIQNPTEASLDSLYEIKSIFQKVTGIEIILDRGNIKESYGRSINKILIRAMQEALTNSVRHGLATSVTVYFREDKDKLYMTVKDNGIGSKQVVKGIGLSGMEERLKTAGGTLRAGSSAEGGFKIELEIPILDIFEEGVNNKN